MNGTNRFIIHKHKTTNPHYDLRIEIEGILKSWIIPKTLPAEINEKRLAIEDEDQDPGIIERKAVVKGGDEMITFIISFLMHCLRPARSPRRSPALTARGLHHRTRRLPSPR